MKKFLCILLAILLVFGLAAAGGYAYAWYRNNNIFVDDAVYPIDSTSLDLRGQDISFDHYNTVRTELPDCQILWDVPFQGAKYPNNSESLTVTSLTQEDVELILEYFPSLKTLDASGCQDYAILEGFKAALPDCEVIYQVSLGADSFPLDTTELVLENGDYDFAVMKENLKYLPNVTGITLKTPELTLEQVDELKAAYEAIAVSCTVDILGQEYDTRTTELDLSALTSADVAAVSEKLAMLPGLTNVKLTDASGASQLTLDDVKVLQTAAPEVVFDYTFDFYGYTISTADEEVHIKNQKIGDEGIDEVRAVLDLLPNCSRFVLENCQISNEVMADLRDEYRDKTKIVWRVNFGIGSTLTDAEIIRAVYDLVDDNCYNLIYCEDVRYMDIGHNEWLDSCDFVAGMPNLEYCIISGAPIKDLTPFQNCKKLKVLEAAFCEYIESVEPLVGCESLERLNISYTHVTDLSPLDDLNLVNLCAMYYPKSRVPQEEQDRFAALKPDCKMTFVGEQPYGSAWRYDEDNNPLEWYSNIREVFRYDIYPNTPNHVGWYLETEE